MRQLVLISVFTLFVGLTSFAQKPGFFVKSNIAAGDTAAKYKNNFERLIATNISEAFHCATVNTQSSLVARLSWEKDHQLMGGEGELNLCSYLKCDYLVLLEMIEVNSTQLEVVAKCFNFKKKEVIAEAVKSFSMTMNYAGFASACNQISDQLIKELGKYEICAFQGSVVITDNLYSDTTKLEQYSVYCNETDYQYRKEEKVNENTQSEWRLERKGIPWTTGTMTFSSSETQEITEEDGCHLCPSGRRGGLITNYESSLTVKGHGLSNESIRNGTKQDDTRVELKFFENGTYMLIAKGTSKPAKGEDFIKLKAQGTCDNQPPINKKEPREITIPLKVIFGPYTGKTTDKILQQKDKKKEKDPITNEIHEYTIDFNLKQKDN